VKGGQHTLVELPLGARPLPANTDPARYERAALRWLGRFIDERSPPLTEVALAASALRLELHRKTATNVGPLTPIGGGRGEFAVELSLSRPLPQSQRGDGERTIAHVTEAAGPPRPILPSGGTGKQELLSRLQRFSSRQATACSQDSDLAGPCQPQ
jgi:hypothetical protein